MGLFLKDGELSDSGGASLFAAYVASWSKGRIERIRGGGAEAREADITGVLCALQGEAEDALVDYLLSSAELPLAERQSHRYLSAALENWTVAALEK